MEETISKAILSGDLFFLNSYLNQGGSFNKMTLFRNSDKKRWFLYRL